MPTQGDPTVENPLMHGAAGTSLWHKFGMSGWLDCLEMACHGSRRAMASRGGRDYEEVSLRLNFMRFSFRNADSAMNLLVWLACLSPRML